jgi:adenylate cyclase
MSEVKLEWIPSDTGETVTRLVPEGVTIRLGRAPAAGWEVTGDPSISREHVDVWVQKGKLAVRCVETARLPVVVDQQERRDALLACGGSFQIGSTTFQVVREAAKVTKPAQESGAQPGKLVLEQTYAVGELSKVAFNAAQQQIEILADLPESISSTRTDEDLAVTVAGLLLKGIPQAEAVAVVQYDAKHIGWDPDSGVEPATPKLMRVETREDFNGRFRPSRRLMLKSLALQESVLHIWETQSSQEFTMSEGLGWAFSCPVRGEGCAGWCLYVSGKGARSSTTFFTKDDLAGDLRFVELLTSFIASIRQVRLLQTQRTQLSAFFSPKVIENLTTGVDRTALDPSEREVTVLFCDLRGFSKRSETLQHDLLSLLKAVSEALGLMAEGVLGQDGAIADFQGDAVLGFWGWPLAHLEGPLPACRCALRIEAAFRAANENANELLAGISCGVGVAHGRALAGKIGTERQSKIGVFGPVVNQGSRLEGMTKQFGVSICVDEPTANYVRKMPSDESRVRHLARVRPKGMVTPLNVFALYPSEQKLPSVSSQLIAQHEQAVERMIGGHWSEARGILETMPASDGPAAFLRSFLERSGESPPADWDGTIRLDAK